MEFLSRNTPDFISPLLWLPSSPDLNPVDYEVWGVLQQHVYRSRIRDVDHLKQQSVTDVIVYELLRRLFHIGNFCFWVPFSKQLLLRNCVVDFVEICNVCSRKAIIKAAKRIFNSDKICHSYCDFYFGITFLEHSVDAACCYRWSGMVCRSVCHDHEPCKNSWTVRDAVWDVDSDGLKEPDIRWGSDTPTWRGNFEGEKWWPIVRHIGTPCCELFA